MNKHLRELAIGSSILLHLLYGCSLENPTESNGGLKTPRPVEQEDRGTPLTTSASNFLVWSQVTNEIIFVSRDGGITTIDPATGRGRAINGECSSCERVCLSRDGLSLYYFADASWYYISVWGGPPSLLVTGANWQAKETAIFSPDNTSVAWCKANNTETLYDSTFLYNRQTKERLFLMCGAPLAFSPDGSQLLVRGECVWGDHPQQAGLYVIDLASRPIRATLKWHKTEFLLNSTVTHWDRDGLRILSIPPFLTSCVYIVNLTANMIDTVHIPDTGWGYAWSNDGSKIAFWESLFYFGVVPGLPKPDLSTWICSLYVVDLKARETYEVVKTRESGRGAIRFSPDGKKIAYVAGSTIYVKDIQ